MTNYTPPASDIIEIKEKLEIAVKCLKEYAERKNWANIYDDESASFEPLYRCRKWKDDFGYKEAEEVLKKIKGVKTR